MCICILRNSILFATLDRRGVNGTAFRSATSMHLEWRKRHQNPDSDD